MNDSEPPSASPAHLETVKRAMSGNAFVTSPIETVHIRNFTFNSRMLDGWTFARARRVDIGNGVQLIQVNVQVDGSDSLARIEVLEAESLEKGRLLFEDMLTRFQRDPATLICVPPKIGEAEACYEDSAIVFLRGNLVVTVTTIGGAALTIGDLAERIDRSICEKPKDVRDAATDHEAAGRETLMIKTFTRHETQTSEAYAISSDGTAHRASTIRDQSRDDKE